MKVLRTPKMRTLLREGKRKATGNPPSEGNMIGLIHRTEKNGWHYQVEWIHDIRLKPEPYVVVYAFRPPRNFCARAADYYLEG